MCLAIPGKVVKIYEENNLMMGTVDYSGTTNTVCLAYVPEVTIGQYVIVHAGFALNIIDEEEANKTFALWDEIAQKTAEDGHDIFGVPLQEKPEQD